MYVKFQAKQPWWGPFDKDLREMEEPFENFFYLWNVSTQFP